MIDITEIVREVYRASSQKIESAYILEDDTMTIVLEDGRRSYYRFKNGDLFLYKESELDLYDAYRFKQILRDGKLKGVMSE